MDDEYQHPLWKVLESKLSCPIDWRNVLGDTPHPWAADTLELGWLQCFESVAVDLPEVALLRGMLLQEAHRFDIVMGDERVVEINIDRVIEQAKQAYSGQLGRLVNIEFVAPSTSGASKHFIPKLTREQVIARTKNKPSLFFENPEASGLRLIFWQWFDRNFDVDIDNSSLGAFVDRTEIVFYNDASLIGSKIWRLLLGELANFRVLVRADGNSPGASGGEVADAIVLDFNLTANGLTLHAYPELMANSARYEFVFGKIYYPRLW